MESISQIMSVYFGAFFHPFKTQRDMRDNRMQELWESQHERQGVHVLPTASAGQKNPSHFISLEETVGVSWLLEVMSTFYRLLWMYMGIKFFEYQSELSSAELITEMFRDQIHTASQMLFLFWILLGAVFFPVSTWFYAKFWTVVIKFFTDLFEKDADEKGAYKLDAVIDQVICQSLTSHSLYIVPIMGKSLAHFLGLFYLFIGLRQNLGFSNSQSALVIISPLILMALSLFSVVAMFFVTFGLI